MVALAIIGCAELHLANNVTTQIHFTLTAALAVPFLAGLRGSRTLRVGGRQQSRSAVRSDAESALAKPR